MTVLCYQLFLPVMLLIKKYIVVGQKSKLGISRGGSSQEMTIVDKGLGAKNAKT